MAENLNFMTSVVPKVTVLMPVYNGEQFLREAIDSILNQTFTDFEFMIINDASTDDSVEIVESYKDRRINLIHNETNIGLIATLNKGLALACGEYIARMDADDKSLPERLAKQVKFLDAEPDIAVVGTGIQMIDGSGHKIGPHILFPESHNLIRWRLCFSSPIVHPTVMLRKAEVLKVGGYRPEAQQAEDYDLWERLSHICKLLNMREVLLLLRKHQMNVSVVNFIEQQDNSVTIRCRAISEILGREVSPRLILTPWSQRIDTRDQLFDQMLLVRELCSAFIEKEELSVAERKLVARDAAARIFVLARKRIREKQTWLMLIPAFNLDPFFAFRAVLRFLRDWVLTKMRNLWL